MTHDRYPTNPKLRENARRLRRDAPVPERILWGKLRGSQLLDMRFRRQHPIGPFIVDFCCPNARLIIELDGLTHVGTGEKDDARTAVLEHMGYRVVRFTNDDVLQHMDVVLEHIAEHLGDTPRP